MGVMSEPMDGMSNEWYVSFEEFREEDTGIYIFFINFLMIPCVTSYPKLSILDGVD